MLSINEIALLTIHFIKNVHTIFKTNTGLVDVVNKYRMTYMKMVLSSVGRKPDIKFPFSLEEIILILAGIHATPQDYVSAPYILGRPRERLVAVSIAHTSNNTKLGGNDG